MTRKHKFNLAYIFGISLVSALGGLLFDYDLVVIGGAKEFYVIDFGVAKAINQQLTEKTLFTAFGQMVGTPPCMSPGTGRDERPGRRYTK